MLEWLLAFVFIGCMLLLAVHEEWLARSHPRFLPACALVALGVGAALGLMVLL